LENQRKKDVRVLQEKVDILEEQVRDLLKSNSILEKRNSKLSESNSKFLRNLNMYSSESNRNKESYNDKQSKEIIKSPTKNVTSLSKKVEDSESVDDQDNKSSIDRNVYIQEKQIKIIEGKLGDDLSNDSDKGIKTSKAMNNERLSFVKTKDEPAKNVLSPKPAKSKTKTEKKIDKFKESIDSKDMYSSLLKFDPMEESSVSPKTIKKTSFSNGSIIFNC
jgi:phosphotransferase system IIB component